MATTTSTLAKLLYPGLRKIYDQQFAAHPQEYKQVVTERTTNQHRDEDYTMAALNIASSYTEGAPVSYVDPVSGYTKYYTPGQVGIGFQVTHLMRINDLYGKINKMPKACAQAIQDKVEYDVASIFANAFTASPSGVTAAADSLALCSTAHTLLGGGTLGNRPSTDVDLSPTALKAALIALDQVTDDYGNPRKCTPSKLVVSPSDRYTAIEILQSKNKPWEMSNTVNALEGELTPFVYHWLTTDTDAWFVLCKEHDLQLVWREKPKLWPGEDDYDTGNAKFKATCIYTWGFTDWRGVYGTTGA